jgi:mRNA interferase MazF
VKRYDEWNRVKQTIDNSINKVFFKEREIFWLSVGENVGFEQNGKGEIFSRPVLVLKKFSRNMFFGIPLSTQIKEGSFFFTFELLGKQSNALLVQGRLYDSKRLENKIGMINQDDFNTLKKKMRELLDV